MVSSLFDGLESFEKFVAFMNTSECDPRDRRLLKIEVIPKPEPAGLAR
jgi:hypothetical protein